MKPHHLFALLAALAMTLMFAATAFAGTVTWTGQGVTDGELNNVDCEASETGFGLFIYTGDSDTAPVLTIDGVPYTGVQQGQGSWHFEVPLPDPLDPAEHTITVTFTGDHDPGVLTLSHGCPGETTTTTTTTTSTTTETTDTETTTTETTTTSDTTTTETTTSDTTTIETTDTETTDTETTDTETTDTTTSDTTTDTTDTETTDTETTDTETTDTETTPEGSVEELTPPSTDMIGQPGGSSSVSTGLLLVLAGVLSSVLVLVPASVRRRR